MPRLRRSALFALANMKNLFSALPAPTAFLPVTRNPAALVFASEQSFEDAIKMLERAKAMPVSN